MDEMSAKMEEDWLSGHLAFYMSSLTNVWLEFAAFRKAFSAYDVDGMTSE
jgi:hypothetical protein